MVEDIPPLMSIGQRTIMAATRVKDLFENQMAILKWLFIRGHEIDCDEFFDDLVEDQIYYVLKRS